MSTETAVHDRIDAIVKEHRVVLFMKGDRQQPMCGFSAAASKALSDLLPEYHTVNVLDDPEIRQGIKDYGSWPTIPQLYVGGELVGGADIVKQMYASGELHDLFGLPQPDRTPPEITITDKAVTAINQAMGDAGGMVLHLEVGVDHDAGFRLAEAGDSDIVTHANGLEVHMDVGTAQRAKGITIDWVETMQGAGLSLKFPGATEVKSMSVAELKQHLDANDGLILVDVRPAPSRAKAAPLAQARVLEEEGYEGLNALPKDTTIAFICHHGVASRGVAEQFAAHGFKNIYSVEGGMDKWAEEIDPSVPRY
ncbi:MAG TPA: Grx4 family monothiol glutaredoxin [Oleiagrimonas sp.]|nr:Grx4 family monothiol glutaredoxin [Oleiagrimonas sp.]